MVVMIFHDVVIKNILNKSKSKVIKELPVRLAFFGSKSNDPSVMLYSSWGNWNQSLP